MNKVLEFTPREEVILLKGLQLVLADKSSLLNSDDPAIVKVARNSIQEIRNLIDDVTSAEPTYLGGYAEK